MIIKTIAAHNLNSEKPLFMAISPFAEYADVDFLAECFDDVFARYVLGLILELLLVQHRAVSLYAKEHQCYVRRPSMVTNNY